MATYTANPLPVKISDGAGNLLTSNSTTPAGKFSLDINAVSILGTAIVNAGLAGVLSVGGNVAAGVAPTANPVTIAGLDNAGTKLTQIPTVTTNNVTAFNLGMEVMPAVARASGTAVTAGNAVALQLHSTTGGLFTNLVSILGTSVVTGGVAGILAVGGNVANAVTATANPVPVGGIFTTTPATLTTGQTATLQFTAAQNIKNDISTWAGAVPTIATQMGLGLSQTPTVPFVGSHMIGRKSDGTGTSEPATLSTMYDVDGSGTAENVVGVSLRKAGAAGASTEYGATGSPLFVSMRPVPDATSTYCPTAYDSAAFEFSKVVKASAGVVYAIRGYNGLASSQFIQIHNTTTVPANGAVPIVVFTAAGSANFSFTPSEHFGKFFSTGITILVSSTAATTTISLVTGVWFDVLYN